MNTMEDWDKWVELAREDPQKFEQERAAAIEEFIISQSDRSRQRCRRLQWKIDAVRQTSPNSLASCIRIYDMLMDSVYGANGLLEAINLLRGGNGENLRSGKLNASLNKKGFLVDFKSKRRLK